MPIYEYRCTNGHTFETLQRISDPALEECERCGAPARRVLHAPAIHFKGSGFHNTDYGTARRNRELAQSGDKGADASEAKGAKESSDGKASGDGAKPSAAPAKAASDG